MDLKDILPIIFERANADTTLWNYQLTVILTGIAFLVAASRVLRSALVMAGLTVGYLAFAFVNYDSIATVEAQREQLVAYTKPLLAATQKPELADLPIDPPGQDSNLKWHVAGDIGAIAAIWLLPWFVRRAV